MAKKLLLVIDAQYDFIFGSLAVNSADKMMEDLASYVKDSGKGYESIIATADWHPITHCSFKENGGEWPIHCLQFSQGASIYPSLLMEMNKCHESDFKVLTKGLSEEREEYSIFKNNESKEKIVKTCENLSIEEIDICGIALDYCVINSLKDGLKVLPNMKFNILMKYCPSIGDGVDAVKFMEESERTNIVY